MEDRYEETFQPIFLSSWFPTVQRLIPDAALLWTQAALMEINKPNKIVRKVVSVHLHLQLNPPSLHVLARFIFLTQFHLKTNSFDEGRQ